jgi:hypothetical protein
MTATGQVVLAGGKNASALLHEVLVDVLAAFPETFANVEIPSDVNRFRKNYAGFLPSFEAARVVSSERTNIARRMSDGMQKSVEWQTEAGGQALVESLQEVVHVPITVRPLKQHDFTTSNTSGWCAGVSYQGEQWGRSDRSRHDIPTANTLANLGARLAETGMASQQVSEALSWLEEEVLESGLLNLPDRKIAVIGAGAEMAPTRLWLEAGADVLWLDTQPPPSSWWELPNLSGRLFWPAEGVDLLSNPHAVLATLIEFAAGEPLDLGLYAYAPGQAREIRLTAAMNAIVNALPQSLIRSVTMLVSPTTPVEVSASELAFSKNRLATRPMWERSLEALGLLGSGSATVAHDKSAVVRSVVPTQGVSYQAAQYLGKIMMAECWSGYGQLGVEYPEPLRVSANTAAITRTHSLSHPVFNAAFGGAAAFGVETLAPQQSRRINGLLAVRDWLYPELPNPGQIRVHGGIHTLPYPLEPALRIAALIGFARSPKLLLGLMR